MAIDLRFHGAAGAVTGSCMALRIGEHQILIDCGLFQGSRSLEALNYEDLPFDPAAIDLVVLTHAHLDHSGRLPLLTKQGFTGELWCTPATAQLLGPLLMDAAKLQAADADRRNERPDRAGLEPFHPLYDATDVGMLHRHVRQLGLGEWVQPLPGIELRFSDAHHILGAVSVELRAAGQSLLFSGDIGTGAAIDGPSAPAAGWDHVICESTYGDRDRPAVAPSERREKLALIVERTVAGQGNVIVPTFALQRTQAVIEDLVALFDDGRLGQMPVYIDAPLADRVTQVYRRFHLPASKGRSPFDHPQVHFVRSVAESRALNHVKRAVILAGSGMCSGGRIRYHLARNLPRKESTILFVGYQAAGTLGAVLRNGARAVRISGADIPVHATVAEIDAYSAHADHSALLAWIAARGPVRGTLFLDHGEPAALAAFAAEARLQPGKTSVIVPALGEAFALDPAAPAHRVAAGLAGVARLTGEDWHNRAAALHASLDSRLRDMVDDEEREKALDEVEAALTAGRKYPARSTITLAG